MNPPVPDRENEVPRRTSEGTLLAGLHARGVRSSARASILSGRSPYSHGDETVLTNLPPDVVTFGDPLSKVGYTSTCLGKWHVGRDRGPPDFGFEYLGGSDRGIESGLREYREEFDVDTDRWIGKAVSGTPEPRRPRRDDGGTVEAE